MDHSIDVSPSISDTTYLQVTRDNRAMDAWRVRDPVGLKKFLADVPTNLDNLDIFITLIHDYNTKRFCMFVATK